MKVIIGSRNYTIKDWEKEDAVVAHRFGQCDSNQGLIYVDNSLPPDKEAVTLLHEIMHAIWVEWCLEDEDKEERTVDALAKGVTQTIVLNRYLRERLQALWDEAEK